MKKCIFVEYQGQKLSLVKIAEMNQVSYGSLHNKYQQTGEIEQAIALAKAVQTGPRRYIDFCGKKMTINQIAQIYGINYQNLQSTYQLTSDIDEAITMALNGNFIVNGENKYRTYQAQEHTESIHKLKNLTYTINETGLKTHVFLNDSVDPIAAVEDRALVENLKKQISTLSEREQKILCLHYGLDDGVEHTNTEIAPMFGISAPRIWGIEDKAFRKLRHPKMAKYFSPSVSADEVTKKFIEKIKKMIASMPLKTQRVVCLLYGITDDQYHTYNEIARESGLTSLQVMCIEKMITKKDYFLRHDCEMRRKELEAKSIDKLKLCYRISADAELNKD